MAETDLLTGIHEETGGGKAPEIQTMYSLNFPVSAIRTRVRQEFERHRFVNQLPAVDTLLFKSHAEYQVRLRVNPRAFILLARQKGLGSSAASSFFFSSGKRGGRGDLQDERGMERMWGFEPR